MVTWRQNSVCVAVRPTSLRQSAREKRFDGVKRRLVYDDASLRVPNSLRNPVGKSLNIGIRRQKSLKTGISNGCKKRRVDAHSHWSITSPLQNNPNPALLLQRSHRILQRTPLFWITSGHYRWWQLAKNALWSSSSQDVSAGNNRRILRLQKNGTNVQAWVIIVQADQVQGALKSQLQRHVSCLHGVDNGAQVSLGSAVT